MGDLGMAHLAGAACARPLANHQGNAQHYYNKEQS
jgi:hypothetical protein